MERRDRICHEGAVRTENTDEKGWKAFDQDPDGSRIEQSHGSHQKDPAADLLRSAGAIVVTDDWGCALCDGQHRCLRDLAHGVDDGHDRDIQFAPQRGQDTVACDVHQAVGKLHDEGRHPKAYDLTRERKP